MRRVRGLKSGLLLAAALVLSSCAKHEVVTESVRPVQLTQVKLGTSADTAVFAGEIKPRHDMKRMNALGA